MQSTVVIETGSSVQAEWLCHLSYMIGGAMWRQTLLLHGDKLKIYLKQVWVSLLAGHERLCTKRSHGVLVCT
jgi:hypothetical protein